jgi:5-methylcytosine-specific restriction enzyme A
VRLRRAFGVATGDPLSPTQTSPAAVMVSFLGGGSMPVSFEHIQLGGRYTRPALAAMWGYTSYEAISRGAVTPARTPFIILFITKEKQPFLTQYNDALLGDRLVIEGETSHTADARIVAARAKGDEIHLFYRERHHQEFEYKGQVYLVDHEVRIDRPSHFEFALDSATAFALHSLDIESATHGVCPEEFIPEEEGRKRIRQHIEYERSIRNRARAIALHGTRCIVCGFSFDEAYGAEHAAGYIEIHHVTSLASGNVVPNVDTDLVPLCSNCHSMAHRRRRSPLTVEELRALVRRGQA